MIRSIFVLLAGVFFCVSMYFEAVAQTVSDVRIDMEGRATQLVLKSDLPLKRQILYHGSSDHPAIIIRLPDIEWNVTKENNVRNSEIDRLTWHDYALVAKLKHPMSANVLELRPDEQDERYRTVLKLQRISSESFAGLAKGHMAVVEGLKLPNMYDLTNRVPRPFVKPDQKEFQLRRKDLPDRSISIPPATDTSSKKTEGVDSQVKGIIPHFLMEQKNDSRKVIVIDPGHGGKDPGTSQHGAIEKEIVLDVAQRMRDVLVKNDNYVVYLTRDGDEFIGLDERLEFARDMNADIFVSLHADAAESPVASGASVFTLSPQGLVRSEDMIETNNWMLHDNLAVDELSNSVLDDLWKRQTKNLSPVLAEKVIDEFKELIPMVDYPLRSAGYYVLLDLKAPAVLVELGYLTNILDARRLVSAESRSEAAQAIVRAIDSYFEYFDKLVSTE